MYLIMPDIAIRSIELDQEDAITQLYDTYGYGDSAHAFKTMYIWAQDMSMSLHQTSGMYTAKMEDDGDNTWLFPVGNDAEKCAFIEEMLSKGDLKFRYMTKWDTFFLQQYFPGKFKADPAPDDSEYIYDRNTIENLPGGSFSRKRDYVRQLIRNHDMETKYLSADIKNYSGNIEGIILCKDYLICTFIKYISVIFLAPCPGCRDLSHIINYIVREVLVLHIVVKDQLANVISFP